MKLNKFIRLSGTSLFTLQFSLAFASAEEVGEEAVTTKKKNGTLSFYVIKFSPFMIVL